MHLTVGLCGIPATMIQDVVATSRVVIVGQVKHLTVYCQPTIGRSIVRGQFSQSQRTVLPTLLLNGQNEKDDRHDQRRCRAAAESNSGQPSEAASSGPITTTFIIANNRHGENAVITDSDCLVYRASVQFRGKLMARYKHVGDLVLGNTA